MEQRSNNCALLVRFCRLASDARLSNTVYFL